MVVLIFSVIHYMYHHKNVMYIIYCHPLAPGTHNITRPILLSPFPARTHKYHSVWLWYGTGYAKFDTFWNHKTVTFKISSGILHLLDWHRLIELFRHFLENSFMPCLYRKNLNIWKLKVLKPEIFLITFIDNEHESMLRIV